MIERVFFKTFSSYLLSLTKNRLRTCLSYHTDSIEENFQEEVVYEEQRLSSHETTKILRTHEASIDLEDDSPVKYYEVNYLGANNPPGMCTKFFIE